MAEIKLTKNELRMQEARLGQLERYLPTLQLKKAQLQQEVGIARLEIEKARHSLSLKQEAVEHFVQLLSDTFTVEVSQMAVINSVEKSFENIQKSTVSIKFVPAHKIV